MTPVAYLERTHERSAAPAGSAPGQFVGRPHQELRLLDASLRCIARWGVAKTSLEDVAREARCSRATVYRAFPGGKEAMLEALAALEVERFFQALGDRLAGAATLDDVLVEGVVTASSLLQDHSALAYLLAHEPEVVLPRVSFGEMERVFGAVSDFARPHLARWIDPSGAERLAEWMTRIVVSYASCGGERVDITDAASARRVVETFVLPATEHLARPSGQSRRTRSEARLRINEEGEPWPAPSS